MFSAGVDADREVVDHLRNNYLYKKLFGPAGGELGTDPNSVCYKIPTANYPLGIIAGNKRLNKFTAKFIFPKENSAPQITPQQFFGLSVVVVEL